jgi:hypothetical protein
MLVYTQYERTALTPNFKYNVLGLPAPRGVHVADAETDAATDAWKFEKGETGEKPALTEKPENFITGVANFTYVKEAIGEKPVLDRGE